MNDANIHVLSNVIAAVESGGQIYSDNRDWTAYAGAYTNSDKEVTCTLGPYQAYGDEAQEVCQYVLDHYPATMVLCDRTGNIRYYLKQGFVKSQWNPNATDKANLIMMLGTKAGHEACEHVFDERLLKYIANAEAFGVTDIQAQMMWAEIEHLGGLNPVKRVFGRCGGNYTLSSVFEALKEDQSQTGSNSVSSQKYWSRHTACVSMIEDHSESEDEKEGPFREIVFNANYSLAKTAAICAAAKANHWTYGDSHSTYPCDDGVISCDRLLARSDADANDQLGLGLPAQPQGGYTCLNMESYYDSTGLFYKISDPTQLQAGDRVLMYKDGQPCHAFQIAAYSSESDIDKYDLGSQERINAGGYFTNVPLNEWGDGRTFYAAWRLKADDGIQNGGVELTDIYISNCGHDERGQYTGGQPGDQTGTEYELKSWYNRPWNCVLRYPDTSVAECIAKKARAAAKNNCVGYNQSTRETYWEHLEASNYDPSQVSIPCAGDCSSTTNANVKAVGFDKGIEALKNIDIGLTTGDIRKAYSSAGFQILTDSKYTSKPDYLQPGDILLLDGHHVAIFVGAKDDPVVPVKPPVVTTWKATGTATLHNGNVSYANVRADSFNTAPILRKVDNGNRFEVDGVKNGSYTHVNVAGTIGWIWSDYVVLDGAPAPTPATPEYPIGKCTKSGTVVYRDKEFTNAFRQLDKGNLVDVMEKHVIYKVRIGDSIGYIEDNISE